MMQDHGMMVPQATADMMSAQQSHYNDMDSEETARYTEQAPDYGGKKLPQTGGAVNKVQLAQIENAIDCLLAQ